MEYSIQHDRGVAGTNKGIPKRCRRRLSRYCSRIRGTRGDLLTRGILRKKNRLGSKSRKLEER